METADLSWLAAKQKRVKSWDKFLNEELQDPAIKAKTADVLKVFSEKLLQVWENKSYSAEDKLKIDDLERILEQLNEEARLLSKPEKTA